ncbi:ribonuclease D [bacterium]|nr:ribonuclease D [bacterium]
MSAAFTLHHQDLPTGLNLKGDLAVDTETTGLSLMRDRLCLVQISDETGAIHLVKFDGRDYSAPNLRTLLTDAKRTKIFHFARFDVGMFWRWMEIETQPVFCTKIASKLVRTYTDRHGLKDVCNELLGVELSKQQQSSDWAAENLSDAQLAYAASDVLHLHKLRDELTRRLKRENRLELAEKCFGFLPSRAKLDCLGWEETDIFAHS